MQLWANYFIATAGAAAALTGLLFVSVSLNLKRVLSIDHLPKRALESLIVLANILLCGSFCLIPQPLIYLGTEILACSIVIWIFCTRIDLKIVRAGEKQYRRHYLQNLVFTQLAVLPYIAGGIMMLAGADSGFYFIVPGISMSFVKSLTDAWVLLVEINR